MGKEKEIVEEVIVKEDEVIKEEEETKKEALLNPLLYKEKFIYLLRTEEGEFYTYSLPEMGPDFLICYTLWKKMTATQQVMNNTLTENYREDINNGLEWKFNFNDGVMIKKIPVNELTWFEFDKKQAEEMLKTKVLNHYQDLVPTLLSELTVLKEAINTFTERKSGEKGGETKYYREDSRDLRI